ncbi:MAG: redoxin domain-containing protein [Chitinophagaceae bacterium]|nr:redoxin domain-containing protein [Chitinophagaceae bacterium]
MRKYILFLFITCFHISATAQSDSAALYLRYPTIPYFTITKIADSSRFAKADLNKKKATIIFIFSPDCGHCQQKIKELIAENTRFKKVQIVMASPLEHQIIKKFYTEYKIADYSNIIMGRDPSYFFGSFYSIRSLPGIFVYDKKGRLIKSLDGKSSIDEIAKAL